MSGKVSDPEHAKAPDELAYDDSFIGPDPPNPEMEAYHRRRLRRQKVILAISSIVLTVTIITIGASGILCTPSSSDDSADHDAAIRQSHIDAFCQLTDFESLCASNIRRYTDNRKSDPKTLSLLSLQAAIDDVGRAYDCSRRPAVADETRRAFADCQDLLQRALSNLHVAYATADSMSPEGSPYELMEILTVLSAAMAYEQTCFDGVKGGKGEEVKEMSDIMINATEQTRNNLAIAGGSPGADLATRAGSPLPAQAPAPVGRRLLGETVRGPIWFPAKGKPDVVVAQDGTGDFKTIREALNAVPKVRNHRFEIYVKEGIYKEKVTVTEDMAYVTLYGDGAKRTIITGDQNSADGLSVKDTATFVALGKAFMARNVSFENTAGPSKGAAVALRVESDLSVFYNCRIGGNEKTLMAYTHRQFYRSCVISGTVDIIYGDAVAVFQSCQIVAKKGIEGQKNTVAAQSRVDRHETTGIIIQNCTVTGDVKGHSPTYLGTPLKERSRIVIMQSYLGDLIPQEGWTLPSASSDVIVNSSFVAEFGNNGPGADAEGRVRWPAYHQLQAAEQAAKFTVEKFIQGGWWLDMTGTPFYGGVL